MNKLAFLLAAVFSIMFASACSASLATREQSGLIGAGLGAGLWSYYWQYGRARRRRRIKRWSR